MKLNTFLNGFCPKVNAVARLEFERAYFKAAVEDFCNTGISQKY